MSLVPCTSVKMTSKHHPSSCMKMHLTSWMSAFTVFILVWCLLLPEKGPSWCHVHLLKGGISRVGMTRSKCSVGGMAVWGEAQCTGCGMGTDGVSVQAASACVNGFALITAWAVLDSQGYSISCWNAVQYFLVSGVDDKAMTVGDDRFLEMASWYWSLNKAVSGNVMHQVVEGPWDGCKRVYR